MVFAVKTWMHAVSLRDVFQKPEFWEIVFVSSVEIIFIASFRLDYILEAKIL